MNSPWAFPRGIAQATVLQDGLRHPRPSATFRVTLLRESSGGPAVIRELVEIFSSTFIRKNFSTDISKPTLKIFS